MIETDQNTVNRSKSYQTILDTAEELMNRHGIRRITVDEICSEAGLSKMTFYRNFDNKTDVAVRIMENMFERGMVAYRDIMEKDIPFPEKMRQLVEMKRQEVHKVGEEFVKDIYHSDDERLRNVMEKYRQSSMAEYVGDLKAAQKAGWIRPAIKTEMILLMLDTLHEKMQDPTVMNLYANVDEMVLELTNFFFFTGF